MVRCAVILAGGFGTRLAPLGDPRPKPLMPVNNVPLLQLQLQRLRDAGVSRVRVCVHHGADMIQAALAEMDSFGMQVDLSWEREQALGTGGAIRQAWSWADFEPAYVLNGDIMSDFPLQELGAFHEAAGGDGALWGIRVADTSRYGVIEADAEGAIQRFVEKPAPGQSSSDVINAGAYVLTRRVVDLIPPGRPVSIERETFPLALESGLRLWVFVRQARWIDIGTPDSYRRANLEANGGRSVVDPSCQVPASARVEESVLLAGCRLGEGAVVRRSLLGRFCSVSPGARVEDKVLAEGSHA